MKIRNRHGHFNLIAPFYDRFFGGMRHDLLLQHLDVQPGMVALDIGGGTGRVAQHVARRGGQIVIVDPSPVMLKEARHKGLPGVRALAEQLPFPANSIDRILIVDAFHHFARQEMAARDLMRVLKPGGRILIEEPDLRFTGTKLIAVMEKLALMQTHFMSPPDLAALFEAHGARLIDILVENINATIILTK
ncbi:MAG TPA: methyltransferase domain-containing protein [Anaerolineae bacterium]|nr:methyltransferase domain-containing protein [Caldilineae bacterium]HID34506.1 methyltransferase domain-containing protein [Anaerolineae bacterium]